MSGARALARRPRRSIALRGAQAQGQCLGDLRRQWASTSNWAKSSPPMLKTLQLEVAHGGCGASVQARSHRRPHPMRFGSGQAARPRRPSRIVRNRLPALVAAPSPRRPRSRRPCRASAAQDSSRGVQDWNSQVPRGASTIARCDAIRSLPTCRRQPVLSGQRRRRWPERLSEAHEARPEVKRQRAARRRRAQSARLVAQEPVGARRRRRGVGDTRQRHGNVGGPDVPIGQRRTAGPASPTRRWRPTGDRGDPGWRAMPCRWPSGPSPSARRALGAGFGTPTERPRRSRTPHPHQGSPNPRVRPRAAARREG